MKQFSQLDNTSLLMEIGRRLAHLRVTSGVQQSELAVKAGMSRDALSRLGNGAGGIRLDSFLSVMRVLGVMCAALCATTLFANEGVKSTPKECVPTARMESRNAAKGRGDGPFGDYWWANRFLSRLELVKSYRGQSVDVVMIGDSIMHFWEWQHPAMWEKFTAGRKVINCGYGGDRTEHVLWRIKYGELDGYEAKYVVLMIGTNNNTDHKTQPENVAKGIEKIIAEIKVKQPKAKIILHPIFPRGNTAESPRHGKSRQRNDRTNVLLKEFASAHPEIIWIDFNDKLIDETGWVPKSIMKDEIHPTDLGYQIWMDALLPVLNK